MRAGIYVDRQANVSVKSDPLPTIIQGIPLRMRQVNVTVDRGRFMFNPSSCAQQSIFGSFLSTTGERSDQTVAFQPVGCGDLDLNQKLSLNLTNKSQMTDGKHPGVDATVVDAGPGSGGANIKKVEVKLPLSLALDPDNAQGLCKPEQRVALACPKSSIVGQATAKSVLAHDLTGPVYFVEGLRKDPKSGRTIRTLPKLWIPLSGDGVTIDLDASSAVDSSGRLVTTFDAIPDAPIKRFQLKITGGKHGILVVSDTNLCQARQVAEVAMDGQNGKNADSTLTSHPLRPPGSVLQGHRQVGGDQARRPRRRQDHRLRREAEDDLTHFGQEPGPHRDATPRRRAPRQDHRHLRPRRSNEGQVRQVEPQPAKATKRDAETRPAGGGARMAAARRVVL